MQAKLTRTIGKAQLEIKTRTVAVHVKIIMIIIHFFNNDNIYIVDFVTSYREQKHEQPRAISVSLLWPLVKHIKYDTKSMK